MKKMRDRVVELKGKKLLVWEEKGQLFLMPVNPTKENPTYQQITEVGEDYFFVVFFA